MPFTQASILIANKDAWKKGGKRKKLENIKLLITGTLDAENYVGLKCNTRKRDLDKIIRALPALHNPTISSLSDKNWFAVETILRINEVKKIIPRLKRAGATGIVEYPVNKIIA